MKRKRTQRVGVYPVVVVDWVDSCTVTGWHDKNDMDDLTPAPCISAGLFIRQTRTELVLAQSSSATTRGYYKIIPRSCVRRIRRLGFAYDPTT